MIRELVLRPGPYFRKFPSSDSSWLVACSGYYLVSLSQTFSNSIESRPNVAPLLVLAKALLVNLAAIPIGMLFWGVLWLWLGARLARGRAPLTTTVRAIGYGFVPPGIPAATILVALPLASPQTVTTPGRGLLVYLAIALAFGCWALVLCWKAVRGINGFSLGATALAFAWLPALALAWIAVDELLLK